MTIITKESIPELLRVEMDERLFTRIQVPVTPLSRDTSGLMNLPPRGTITLVCGLKDSHSLQRVIAAARTENFKAIDSEIETYCTKAKQLKNAAPRLLGAESKTFRNIPCLLEVSHGDKVLISGYPIVHVEQGELTLITMPYNGGGIKHSGLTVKSYYRDGAHAEVAAVVLANPPKLSVAEIQALRLLPEELLELNIGSPTFNLAYAAGLSAALFVAICYCATKFSDRHLDFEVDPIDDASIQQLGPGRTAIELVNVRRKIIAKIDGAFAQSLG